MKVACAISQLICSNAAQQSRKETTVSLHNSRDHETPFPMYIGLKIHFETRLCIVIAKFHTLSICVSFNRILEVRKMLALSVCKHYENYGVVIPSNMRLNVFTTADVDNHDVKNNSRDEFHGTSVTMTNHRSKENMGNECAPIAFDNNIDHKTQVKLPYHYSIVQPVDLKDDYTRNPV